MFSKWTKFNYVLLMVMICLSAVGVIVFSIVTKSWIVALISVPSCLIVYGFWGMIVEMSKILILLGSGNPGNGDGQSVFTNAPSVNVGKKWFCSECGTENNSARQFCKSCGRPKD